MKHSVINRYTADKETQALRVRISLCSETRLLFHFLFKKPVL